MSDKIDEIVEEVKKLQEKLLPLTDAEAASLVACINLTASVMSSPRLKHLMILMPELMFSLALVRATDPQADHAESLSVKLAALIDPVLGATIEAEIKERGL